MVFSSFTFLFLFFPIVLALYYACSSVRIQNLVLLISSIFFYAWGELGYTWVMIATIILGYGFGLLIDRQKNKKLFLIIGISLLLGLLLYFKYANFIALNLKLSLEKIHLPLGISFFVFQAISYLIDIYRKELPAQKNILTFAMYKSFFPQLIAGPIVRYKDIANDIEKRKISLSNFALGSEKFIYGFAQKVLIANTIGQISDKIFQLPITELSSITAWFGALCYMFQIYYDFCGYSNMAIGMAKMFGFNFKENFNYPYTATSITDFWRRWHISLSTWFRDYVYIPLGGNRVSVRRNYLNLYLVFILCGLWHGASWNFLIWGLWHGTFLAIEKKGTTIKLPKILNHVYVWLVVLIGWVIFRIEEFSSIIAYLKVMFNLSNYDRAIRIEEFYSIKLLIVLIFAILLSFPTWNYSQKIFTEKVRNIISIASIGCILLLSLFNLAENSFNPFIYFRF
jgi:alginate O-acetyltransferase complex protein AlgI